MEIIIQKNRLDACRIGARIIARLLREKEKPVLGLATGGTPLPLYQELVRMHRDEGLSFGHVVSFNLDEYVGLDPKHPASFRACMEEHLFRHVDFAPGATHLPDGLAKDIPASCAAYEQAIRDAGGIDVQVLGIGSDGHLAFNEPTSSLRSRTRLKTLDEETRHANAAPFGGPDKVPHHVLTMGLGTIMDARCCLLLAFGASKAPAVRDMVEGPVSAWCPGSVLQFHEKAIVLLDEEAAGLLKRRQYYLDVYAGKPGWQQY
ncbi:MAG TPA: glucosamine-6-phosphate deaminase [Candidatus Ozemobacteraceae bacterium]|nr:glucosamine-6-phosphate deaminase [Candidatus Ozemobacteraceae bacterium]HQG28186.1 glucosamine-6-phosphate deaminase [Candidatus Ozemobacteraceae bacterium]